MITISSRRLRGPRFFRWSGSCAPRGLFVPGYEGADAASGPRGVEPAADNASLAPGRQLDSHVPATDGLQPGSHQRPGYWSCYFAGRGGTLHQARGQMTDHQARKVGALKGSSAFATMRSLAMRFNGILARARARTLGGVDRRRHQFRSRFRHALRSRAAARYRCRLQCN
jgi:hypothetical protein